MIIKSLLFIIVCIFTYESLKILNKMTEEYFISINMSNISNISNISNNEKFVSLGSDSNKNDIAKTIAINCKEYSKNKNKIIDFNQELDETLDTPYYSRFKPLSYNSKRNYYWKTNKIIQEGKRRDIDNKKEIANVKKLLDNETDPDKKEIYQQELDLFKWHQNILSNTDKKTGLDRDMRDITTDYFPEEIGMNRPWIERHSHIRDYSY